MLFKVTTLLLSGSAIFELLKGLHLRCIQLFWCQLFAEQWMIREVLNVIIDIRGIFLLLKRTQHLIKIFILFLFERLCFLLSCKLFLFWFSLHLFLIFLNTPKFF